MWRGGAVTLTRPISGAPAEFKTAPRHSRPQFPGDTALAGKGGGGEGEGERKERLNHNWVGFESNPLYETSHAGLDSFYEALAGGSDRLDARLFSAGDTSKAPFTLYRRFALPSAPKMGLKSQ